MKIFKQLFTKTSKGLIHTIYNDYGPDRTTEFIDDLQQIVNQYLLMLKTCIFITCIA